MLLPLITIDPETDWGTSIQIEKLLNFDVVLKGNSLYQFGAILSDMKVLYKDEIRCKRSISLCMSNAWSKVKA